MIVIKQEIIEYQDININTTHPNWDATTTYAFGDIRFEQHYYYRSVIDGNIGLNPSENPNEWLKWAVSNRYAQIDLRASTSTEWTATTATTPTDGALISSFANTGFDTISFGGVYAGGVTVNVYNSTGGLEYTYNNIVYNRPNSNNWYGYFFDLFDTTVIGDPADSSSFLFRIPPAAGGHIEVIVEAKDGIAKVGYMVGGNEVFVGDSLFGVSLGIEDNSQIEKDDFGVTSIVKRTANTFMDLDVIFHSHQIKQMERKALGLVGQVCLFVGDNTQHSKYEHLMTLGYIESYTTVLSNPTVTTASYSIKETI